MEEQKPECPSGKIVYASERAAKKSRDLRMNKGRRMRAYYCQLCHGYHLSSHAHA